MKDIIGMQNCLPSHSFLSDRLPKSSQNFSKNVVIFTLPSKDLVCLNIFICRASELQNTIWSSITNTCIRSWNSIAQVLDSLSKLQVFEIKEMLFNHLIDNY